ncbi:MAG: DNA polymerase I [Candidatus Omnitrophota bacterium]
MTKEKLFLIDAHALCYRAFFAVRGLADSKGRPTNAVFGFTNILRKFLADFHPRYCAVCFDKEGRTFRQEKYADYKIQRPTMPDELRSQIPLIKKLISAYGIPIMEEQGFEADDLIAVIARGLSSAEQPVVVVSDDKDFFQLVNHDVQVYSPRRESLLYAADVKDVLGVEPCYVTDFIALAGDSSDNIPGVAGIGKVTARKLINQFGSLKEIYAHLEEISSPAIRKKLSEQREVAELSKELAELRTDLVLEKDCNDLRCGEPDQNALFEMFTDLEFHRFAAQFAPQTTGEAGQPCVDSPSEKEISAAADAARTVGRCAVWIPENEDRLFFSAGDAVLSLTRDQLPLVRDVFAAPEIMKICCNGKQTIKQFSGWQMDMTAPVFDIILAGYILNPVRGGQDLTALNWQYCRAGLPDEPGPGDITSVIWNLWDPLSRELQERDVEALFYDIEIPLSRILARMEQAGARINTDHLAALSADCLKQMDSLREKIFRMAGEEFNLNSPKQLSVVLFETLQLPVIKRTKTGFSTNEEVLRKLALQHDLPALILEFRQLAKLKSTYIDALPLLAGEDHIIHAQFNQLITETGRLSSSHPNLQNIPIRTPLGREIRKAFIPLEDGHELLSADYSQIELRVLAHLSEDPQLIRAFQEDQDIHAYTAGLMFDVAPEDVQPEMRMAAKRVNFGIIYGISAFGLAKDLNVSHPEAQDFIDRYFLRYPRVKEFMEEQVAFCRENGYACTLMNRRRDIPEIQSRNTALRQFAERQAINTPVQGTAADLIKLAMVRVQEAMDRGEAASRMIITVHDELVFDVPPGEMDLMIGLVRERMETAMSLRVPIGVDLKRGDNWWEMEKI